MHELEPDTEALSDWIQRATDHICRHLEQIGQARVQHTEGGAELAQALRDAHLSEDPTDLDDILKTVFEQALSVTYNTASPGYLAYIPGGGIPSAAVADLVTATVNRYVGVWLAAPGPVEIEQNVLRWLASLVGWTDDVGGQLLSGGSLANFVAVHTARAERLGDRPTDGVLYTSEQAHHSVFKAARLAGFRHEDIHIVETDGDLVLRPQALKAAVERDRAEGRRPFLVVANAGATNTGVIDDLPGLGDLCDREHLWLHVDAAYGGPFLLTERGKQALQGIDRASSVTIDPHKGLFLPFGTGALLVRDPGALRRAHDVPGAYMPPMQDDPNHVDYCATGPELSREWRGLRLWLPLKLHGVGAFRRALDEKMDLARQAAEQLRTWPDVRIVAEPTLSLLAFRWEPDDVDDKTRDELNQEWLRRTNARGRVFLTGTNLASPQGNPSTFVARICVLHFRTHRARLDMALEDLRLSLDQLREQRSEPQNGPSSEELG